MEIYNKVRAVPPAALKQITGGRLKGMSDINPMWRIEKLTEVFGMCGVGWYYEIAKQWLEQGANDEICAFCNIELYVKVDGEWSKPVTGTGGASFVAKEKNGYYNSDECFKMALTDAISVACKALGFGADVYFAKSETKYNAGTEQKYYCADCGAEFVAFTDKEGRRWSGKQMHAAAAQMSADGKARCRKCREANNV